MLEPMQTKALYWLPVIVSLEEIFNNKGARLEKIHFRARKYDENGPLIYCEDKLIPYNKQIYPIPNTIEFLSTHNSPFVQDNKIYVNLLPTLKDFNIDIGLTQLDEDDIKFYDIQDSTYYVTNLEHYRQIIDFMFIASFNPFRERKYDE